MKKALMFAILAVGIVSMATAHSGRTNSDGCHKVTKTGEYHCH